MIFPSYCEDNDFQQDDKSCWTGDRVGEYSNTVMPTGMSAQKYNPEVPYSSDEFRTNFEVNELADKLTNLKQSISIAVSQLAVWWIGFVGGGDEDDLFNNWVIFIIILLLPADD